MSGSAGWRARVDVAVGAAEARTGTIGEQPAAVRDVRRAYEAWGRLALGVGAFVSAQMGTLVSAGFLGAVTGAARVSAWDLVIGVAVIAIAAAGWAGLIRLWASGRRLSRATAWWLRLPYDVGRSPSAAGWLAARTVNVEPRILVRLVSASFAFLLAAFEVAGGIRALVVPTPAGPLFAVAMVVLGVLSSACCIAQTGGVMRLASALGEGDPVWRRLRRMFGGG